MIKLIRANFSRLLKDKIFLIALAVMAAFGAAIPIIHYADNVNNAANWTGDGSCFVYAFFAAVLTSIVTALFVGTEYGDGTLRNKCIVGHGRGSIYAANLIVCIAAGAMLCAAYIAPHTGFALMLLGGFEAEATAILMYTALSLATVCAFAALSALAAMLCPNKAYTAAICILLAFALLFAGVYITSALNEPEYYQGFSYTENGVTVSEEMERNPNYLSGAKRQAYEFMYDFVPGGQELQIANMKAEKPGILALYDGIILIVSSAVGIIIFRRKDLK